jgi:hypothetical protein
MWRPTPEFVDGARISGAEDTASSGRGRERPVTNQVTTMPGNRRHSATYPNTVSIWPALIRPDTTPSDETGMHGKEKVYGSIP